MWCECLCIRTLCGCACEYSHLWSRVFYCYPPLYLLRLGLSLLSLPLSEPRVHTWSRLAGQWTKGICLSLYLGLGLQMCKIIPGVQVLNTGHHACVAGIPPSRTSVPGKHSPQVEMFPGSWKGLERPSAALLCEMRGGRYTERAPCAGGLRGHGHYLRAPRMRPPAHPPFPHTKCKPDAVNKRSRQIDGGSLHCVPQNLRHSLWPLQPETKQ